jgi:hypothetical protein
VNAREALEQLGAVWSPDFNAYAAGELAPGAVRCALCQHAPCNCPPFGSPEYYALLDARHAPRAQAAESSS